MQGLDDGRVVFASTDILHFDDFFSKITLLQMSASDMWFKDDMFDVVISNAVFEHVQKPAEVLAELFRVVKPWGGIAANWNPFAGFSMGGHDIGIPFYSLGRICGCPRMNTFRSWQKFSAIPIVQDGVPAAAHDDR